MVLEWTPEEAAYSRIELALLQREFSSQQKHSEPTDVFQHQYLKTRGQETLYETCAHSH